MLKYSEKLIAKGNRFGFVMTDLNGIASTLNVRYCNNGWKTSFMKEGQYLNILGFPKMVRVFLFKSSFVLRSGLPTAIPNVYTI